MKKKQTERQKMKISLSIGESEQRGEEQEKIYVCIERLTQ
jgi:hypothetical protein